MNHQGQLKRSQGESEDYMKEFNGYYYCFSHSQFDHGLCSIAEIDRTTAKKAAIAMGARLYIVKYRNGVQQGKKKRISLT